MGSLSLSSVKLYRIGFSLPLESAANLPRLTLPALAYRTRDTSCLRPIAQTVSQPTDGLCLTQGSRNGI